MKKIYNNKINLKKALENFENNLENFEKLFLKNLNKDLKRNFIKGILIYIIFRIIKIIKKSYN